MDEWMDGYYLLALLQMLMAVWILDQTRVSRVRTVAAG